MQTIFSVETSQTVRKMRPFTRFWRKLSVISLLLEIFRRLNANSIAFNTPNAMQTVLNVETSQTVRKMRPFTRFWRKLWVISILLEIFRRLNAISIAFYTPKATHAVFSVETSQTVRTMKNSRDFEENCALFRYCWRDFTVWKLFPLHLTRRMLCKPFLASKQAKLWEKCDHLRD